MFVFHADGTLLQFNPPAGNPGSSETPGVGAWRRSGDGETRARLVEMRLDPATGAPTRGVLDLRVRVAGDRLTGTGEFQVYDLTDGASVNGPHDATLTGRRVTARADDPQGEPE
jgi:hypothetical protein